MAAIEHQLKTYNYTFETILQRLREAMDLIEDCGATYRAADGYIKRMMNLAIFKRILVDNDGSVTAELTEPFRSMIEPVKQQIKQYNYKIRGYNVPTDFMRLITKNYHIFWTIVGVRTFWWSRGDSNSSPQQCECCALPDELLPRMVLL